jgi:hypothetical protein
MHTEKGEVFELFNQDLSADFYEPTREMLPNGATFAELWR